MKNRWIIIILALAAACAFAISVQMGRWWSIGDAGQVEIGPFGSRNCFQGDCRSAGLGWIGASEVWMRTGIATWAGGLVSMFVLVIAAGALAAKRTPRLVAKSALVAIVTAALAGGVFIAKFPGVGGAHVDRGIYAFAIAIVLGVVAMVWVVRAPAPAATRSVPRP